MADVTVTTAAGQVRGVGGADGVVRFLGIPYAKPPFADLRFQLPRPADAWDGVRDATTYGPTAPKPDAEHSNSPLDYLDDPTDPGDDCLNLNVLTPNPDGAGLPVMVWIHGGAFLMGSNRMPLYDGTHFARDGAVFVAMNYRMGIEGFSMLPDAPANLGLHDILLALEWIRDNIAAFGGDPSKVTIFGESAGAGCAIALLARDPGTFQRAIISSAALIGTLTASDAALVAGQVAKTLGVEPTAAGFATVDPQDVANAAKQAFLDMAGNPDPAVWGISTVSTGMPFTTIADGEFLTGRAYDLVLAGQGSGVELLIGSTADEMYAMIAGGADRGATERSEGERGSATSGQREVPEEAARGYLAAFGAAPEAYEVYDKRVGSPAGVMAAAMTDVLFRIPAVRIAEARHASGAARTFVYEFAWPSPIPGVAAAHAIDLGFIFDNLGQNPFEAGAAPQEVADAVHGAWVRFAAGGDPGWAAYEPQTREQMVFDLASTPVRGLRTTERELWAR